MDNDQKVAVLRQELVQCISDFNHLRAAHASDYADRRAKQLIEKLAELDKA